jgi:hypothetical protein
MHQPTNPRSLVRTLATASVTRTIALVLSVTVSMLPLYFTRSFSFYHDVAGRPVFIQLVGVLLA